MECKPRMILAGASAYPRTIDFARLRQIADKANAFLFVDMAHIAGLVAAGLHPNPVPYCDVVTTTTHKPSTVKSSPDFRADLWNTLSQQRQSASRKP